LDKFVVSYQLGVLDMTNATKYWFARAAFIVAGMIAFFAPIIAEAEKYNW
jgi:hypothetical protein